MKDLARELIEVNSNNLRVTPYQALQFLQDEDTRNYFIQSYKFFNELDQDEIKSYVHNNFKEKMSNSVKIDMLDLCIVLNYFDKSIYATAKTYLFDRSNYFVKLSVLDYMNHFFYSLNREEYISLNQQLNKKTNNRLIKFQTTTNLTLYDLNKYSKKVFKTLKTEGLPPYFYYRFANTISDRQFNSSVLKDTFFEIVSDGNLITGHCNEILDLLK